MLCKQIGVGVLEKAPSYLKNSIHSLIEEDVQNVKNEEKGELGREEGEEPLRGVHVILNTILDQMIPQFGQIFFNQTVQLVQAQM